MNTSEDRIATWCGMILAGGALASVPLWVGFNGIFGLLEIAAGGAMAFYGFHRLSRLAAIRPRRRRSKVSKPPGADS